MNSGKKELTKKQKKKVFLLFVDFVSLPILAMSFAVLIAAIATYDASPSIFELIAIASSSLALPLLSVSIFARKCAKLLNPRVAVKELPANINLLESLGVGFGVSALFSYIASVNQLFAYMFIFTGVISFLSLVKLVRDQRENE